MKTIFQSWIQSLTVRPETLRSYKSLERYLPENWNELHGFNKSIAHLSANTQATLRKNLKTFLKFAQQQGYNVPVTKLSVRYCDAQTVYLSEAELQRIASVEIPANLQNIRNAFLISAYTGLRYSDLCKLGSQHISGDTIAVTTQKTGELVRIPIHPIVKAILSRGIPRVPSQQYMNRGIKDVCILAGIVQPVTVNNSTYPKYELVTTHTGRRSFASNLYLSGFPTITLMKITGHKTEAAFMKYIRLTQQEAAGELAKHWGI
jgi:integrase